MAWLKTLASCPGDASGEATSPLNIAGQGSRRPGEPLGGGVLAEKISERVTGGHTPKAPPPVPAPGGDPGTQRCSGGRHGRRGGSGRVAHTDGRLGSASPEGAGQGCRRRGRGGERGWGCSPAPQRRRRRAPGRTETRARGGGPGDGCGGAGRGARRAAAGGGGAPGLPAGCSRRRSERPVLRGATERAPFFTLAAGRGSWKEAELDGWAWGEGQDAQPWDPGRPSPSCSAASPQVSCRRPHGRGPLCSPGRRLQGRPGSAVPGARARGPSPPGRPAQGPRAPTRGRPRPEGTCLSLARVPGGSWLQPKGRAFRSRS